MLTTMILVCAEMQVIQQYELRTTEKVMKAFFSMAILLFPLTCMLHSRGLVTRGLVTRGLDTRGLVTRGLDTRGLDTRRLDTRGLDTRGLDTRVNRFHERSSGMTSNDYRGSFEELLKVEDPLPYMKDMYKLSQ